MVKIFHTTEIIRSVYGIFVIYFLIQQASGYRVMRIGFQLITRCQHRIETCSRVMSTC